MMIYALIIEAHSDDDRLIGLYPTIEAARGAYMRWEDRCYYPFYRIEQRELGAEAFEYSDTVVVYESYSGEHDDA